MIHSCSWLSYVRCSLLSLTISLCCNVDEFVHQIKGMKSLRRIKIYKTKPHLYENYDAVKAKLAEMCNRVLKLNQHPYLSLFVESIRPEQRHVMRPDEKYIVASNGHWKATFSKGKFGGTLNFEQCASCDENL